MGNRRNGEISLHGLKDHLKDNAPLVAAGLAGAYSQARYGTNGYIKPGIMLHQTLFPKSAVKPTLGASVDTASSPDNFKITLDKSRGTVIGDLIHAIKTVSDDPDGTKKKFIVSTAIALGLGATAAISVAKAAKISGVDPVPLLAHVKKEMQSLAKRPAVVAEAASALGVVGGGAYAALNRNDEAKRRRGLTIAALGGAGLAGASLTANKHLPRKELLRNTAEGLGYAGGISAMMAMGTYGQRMEDNDMKREIVNQEDMDYMAKIDRLAAIDNKAGINRALPFTRYLPLGSLKDHYASIQNRSSDLSAANWDNLEPEIQSIIAQEGHKAVRDYAAAHEGKVDQSKVDELFTSARDTIRNYIDR